jgi:hypothetical protein
VVLHARDRQPELEPGFRAHGAQPTDQEGGPREGGQEEPSARLVAAAQGVMEDAVSALPSGEGKPKLWWVG